MAEISRGDSMVESMNVPRFKITFVGDVSVGKTTIINRINGNPFKEVYEATIGVDFFPKKIKYNELEMTLQIWDTAGQEKYRGLIPNYVRGSSIVFIVFDLTNRTTFENISRWIDDVNNIEKTMLILIGNKKDLSEKIVVNKNEIEPFAKEKNIPYYELSAKAGNNLKYIFYKVIVNLPFFKDLKKNENELIDELAKENEKNEEYINIKNIIDNNENNKTTNNISDDTKKYNETNGYMIKNIEHSDQSSIEINNNNIYITKSGKSNSTRCHC